VGLVPKGGRAWEAGPDPSMALWVQGNLFGGAVFGDHPVLMRPMGVLEIVKQAAAYAVSLALVSPERLREAHLQRAPWMLPTPRPFLELPVINPTILWVSFSVRDTRLGLAPNIELASLLDSFKIMACRPGL
jgi:hypothetical protein